MIFFRVLILLTSFSGTIYSADMYSIKNTLQTIAQAISKKAPDIDDTIIDNPQKLLDIAISFYIEIDSQLGSNSCAIFVETEADDKYRKYQITLADIDCDLMLFPDGSISLDGQPQKYSVSNVADLELAFKNDHLIAIRKSALLLAIFAQRLLVRSEDKNHIAYAKLQATRPDLPQELRNQLFKIFADVDAQKFSSWLFDQREFKRMHKETLILKLAMIALENNQPEVATSHIARSRCEHTRGVIARNVFNYYVNHGDLLKAEHVVARFFKKGTARHEEVSQILFERFLAVQDGAADAERILRRNLFKNTFVYDELAAVLFDFYFEKADFTSVERVLDNYFDKLRSRDYETRAKKLFHALRELGEIVRAEEGLLKFFVAGSRVSHELVRVLVNDLIKRHEFDDARKLVTRHLLYPHRRELLKFIEEQELLYQRELSSSASTML